MSLAYGGHSWVIPDDETLAVQRQVDEVLNEELAERRAEKKAAKELKEEAAAKAAKEAEEKAFLEAPVGDVSDEDAKLKRAWGDFGYDDEGVRVWGEATSKRGTAVMDLDAFAAWQQEQEELSTQVTESTADASEAKRVNAAGESLEVDDGVAILDEAKLADELAKSAQEQEELKAEQAEAARKRQRDAVQQNDGTRVIAAIDDEDDLQAWEDKLHEDLKETDAIALAEMQAAALQRKKELEEKLSEFPQLPCPTNPFGLGFVTSHAQQLIEGLLLPQIEDPAALLTPNDLVQDFLALERVPLPAGFGVWPRHATPRVEFAGDYPSSLKGYGSRVEAQKKRLDLDDEEQVAIMRELDRRPEPGVMQARWFNCAAPTMQLEGVYGDEEITLTNLTKEGTLYFKLPGKAVVGELERGRGVERSEMSLDTLVIDVEERTVTMLWRTHFVMDSWEELGTYGSMVGWVLDLDLEDKRRDDWVAAVAKKRSDGTAMLDISELEASEDYWKTISNERKAKEAAEAAVEGTQALDIARMGLYREVEDDGWVQEASDGTVDEAALEKQAAEEEAWLQKKTAAVQALEAQEKADQERREEVAAAVQAGKKVPPPDSKKTAAELKKAKAARAKASEAKAKASKAASKSASAGSSKAKSKGAATATTKPAADAKPSPKSKRSSGSKKK